MQRPISLDSFDAMMKLLDVLNSLEVLGGLEYLVIWEKRPKLTLNRLGNFEFVNPQEVYGARLTFWDEAGKSVSTRKFVLVERFDDEY
jgi:hypothetical protein